MGLNQHYGDSHHYLADTACCDLFFWLDGANSLVSFWNGDGGLLTLLALSSRLSAGRLLLDVELLTSLVEAARRGRRSSLIVRVSSLWRDLGRSVRPAAKVVVVVLTLRWPTLPLVGVGLAGERSCCSGRYFFDLVLTE